jgi:hypothetical protein
VRGSKVGEITSPAAGDDDLSANLRIVFDDQDAPPTIARFYGAKQACGTAANNNDVVFHLSEVPLVQDINVMLHVSGRDIC